MGSKTHTSTPPGAEIWANIDQRMRTGDEDRWLSSRYAGAEDRRALIALYAFCWELARVRLVVSEPALGAIRFQWWRDALEEIEAGETARAHDVVSALKAMIDAERYEVRALQKIVDGYQDAFEHGDRGLEPEAQLAKLAASALCPGHGHEELIDRVAPVFAALRRGQTPDDMPDAINLPASIRPALAHFRLRRLYRKPEPATALSRRLCVLMGVMTGTV